MEIIGAIERFSVRILRALLIFFATNGFKSKSACVQTVTIEQTGYETIVD
jgi:hypothetical protein